MKIKRDKLIRLLFFAGLSVFLLVFYTRFYPLILSSPDDWRYINYWRDFAFAALGRGWNPGRVLPEIFMPAGTLIGLCLTGPFKVGFIRAAAIGMAIVVVIMLTLYIYSFNLMIRRRFAPGLYQELFVTLVFFLFHFLIFRSAQTDNTYLFDGFVPNLYFFYVIPYTLNFSVCFIWSAIGDRERLRDMSLSRKSIFILMLYLAVFSNMFSSIVLAVYVSLRILVVVVRGERSGFREFIYRIRYEGAVLIMWGYSLLAEALGGNAAHLTASGPQTSFAVRLTESLKSSFALFSKANKYMALLSFVLILILFIAALRKKADRMAILLIVGHGVLVYVYELLLAAVVGAEYISRAMVSATYLVDLLLLDVMALLYLLSLRKEIILAAPIAVLIIVSLIDTTQPVFNSPANKLYFLERLDEYYVDLVSEADQNGRMEATLRLPDWYPYELDDSPDLYCTYISSTLYKYGLTSRKIDLTFDVD